MDERVDLFLSLFYLIRTCEILDEVANDFDHSHSHRVCLGCCHLRRSQTGVGTSSPHCRHVQAEDSFASVQSSDTFHLGEPKICRRFEALWYQQPGRFFAKFHFKYCLMSWRADMRLMWHTARSHLLLQRHRTLCREHPVSQPLAQRDAQSIEEIEGERSERQKRD